MGEDDHAKHQVKSVPCAVITVSDTRTPENDESGKTIASRLRDAGHQVLDYRIVPDEEEAIRHAVFAGIEHAQIKVIIINGGTGISPRDITVETVLPMLEKKLDGFGEYFRYLSFEEIGGRAIMSRATGGVVGGKIVLCLPGSTKAVALAMDKIILPQIGHMVWEVSR
jgi:molybdenum cofactor biosynthesis protein B